MRGEKVVGWYDETIDGGRKMGGIQDLDIALMKYNGYFFSLPMLGKPS